MRGLTPRGPSYDWRVDGWENERDRSQRTTFPGVGAPHRPLDALSNRGRVVHGYPATRGHEDALALLRREVDAGSAPTGRTLEALQEANASALDALARVVGDSLDFCWLPGVEEGEARRILGRAAFESMTADNPTIEIVRKGPEPSRVDCLRAAFNEGERLAAERTEAEKETDRRINPVPWYRGQNGRKGAE